MQCNVWSIFRYWLDIHLYCSLASCASGCIKVTTAITSFTSLTISPCLKFPSSWRIGPALAPCPPQERTIASQSEAMSLRCLTISLHGDGFQLQTALSCSSVQLLRTTAVQFGKQGEAAVRTCTCFCTGLDLSSCSLEETRGHHKDQKESSSCLLPQVFRRRRLFPFNFLCTFGLDPPLSPNDKICKRTFKTEG